ncbi:MAG: M16 family metallopeptidase [Cyanobacteriota bacterium]
MNHASSTSNLTVPPLQLAGGCPLWLLPRQGVEVLAARLWIQGGSSQDPPGQRGAHQLLAGVLSRGSGHHSAEALADLVEGCGAGLRCEAHEDQLVLSLKCAPDDGPLLLPLLLEMVQQPWLAADQVALERQLNLQTLQRQREDPFQLAHDGLRGLLYGDGPYGHDPLGSEGDLRALEQRQLQGLLPTLGERGAWMVLCGQVPDQAQQLLEAAMVATPWRVPPQRSEAPSAAAPVSGPATSRLACCHEETEPLILMLGSATVPLAHPDSLALRLLSAHLGIGMSSRLFVALREEHGLAYDVGVHAPARLRAAPFVFHLSTSSDRAGEACQRLLEEWERLLTVPLSDAELSLARAKFRGQEAMGRQTCGQIADRQALLLSHGLPPHHASDCLQVIDQLDAATLQRVAQERLSQPSLSLCGPSSAVKQANRVWRSHPLSRQPRPVAP